MPDAARYGGSLSFWGRALTVYAARMANPMRSGGITTGGGGNPLLGNPAGTSAKSAGQVGVVKSAGPAVGAGADGNPLTGITTPGGTPPIFQGPTVTKAPGLGNQGPKPSVLTGLTGGTS